MQRLPALLRKLSVPPGASADQGLRLSSHLQLNTAWKSTAVLWGRDASTGSNASDKVHRTQLTFVGPYVESHGRSSSASDSANLDLGGGGTSSSGQLHMKGPSITSQHIRATANDSQHNESQEEEEEHGDAKFQLLDAALKHVKEHGWTVDAVRQGAIDLRLSPAAAAMFDRPEAALVKHFVEKCNSDLAKKLNSHKAEMAGLRTSERVRTAVQWRLEMIIPYMNNWTQALAIHTSPGSLPSAIRQVSQLVDDIWYAAGDKSADLNWYTKRALLAGVYTTTEAFMLTDFSPGYADTWESLDRRLEDVAVIGKFTAKAKGAANETLQNIGSALQWAQVQFSGDGQSRGS